MQRNLRKAHPVNRAAGGAPQRQRAAAAHVAKVPGEMMGTCTSPVTFFSQTTAQLGNALQSGACCIEATLSRQQNSWMSNCELFHLRPVFELEQHQVREVLRILLHSIVFQRALGPVKPVERDSELFEVTWVRVVAELAGRRQCCRRQQQRC